MIFNLSTLASVTHDESPGLQTSGIATAGEDNNDNDITPPAALLTYLQGLGAPATAIGAAAGRVVGFDAATSAAPSFLLSGGGSTVASGLSTTVGGFAITLETAAGGNVILGTYMDGVKKVAFAMKLEVDPSSGAGDFGGVKVTTVQYQAIAHPTTGSSYDEAVDLSGLVFIGASSTTVFDDFSSAPAGQNLWTSVSENGLQILVTGLDLGVDTVNTRATSLGSNNQAIDKNEGLVFDFVTGQTPPTSTTAKTLAGIDFSTRFEGTGGSFQIMQTGASAATRVNVDVKAYDSVESAADFHDGTIAGTQKTIGGVAVYLGNTLVRAWDGTNATGSDTGVSFTSDGAGGVKVNGLLVNYRVEFELASGVMDRFSVQNVGTRSLDLGAIGITSGSTEDVGVGGYLRFEDDGPSIAVSATGEAAVFLTTQDAETDGDPTASDTASTAVNFGGVFSALAAYGTDGEGSIVPSYVLSLYGADGVAAGLASNGVGINLFDVAGVIVGSTAGLETDITAANTVFSVSVGSSTGVVTLTQDQEIDHPIADDPTPTATPFDDQLAVLGAGLVKLTGSATITDGDGDTATHSQEVDLGGNVRFADDGPSVAVATPLDTIILNTQDAATIGVNTDTDSADFSSAFSLASSSYGADGAGSIVGSFALGLISDGVDSGLKSAGATVYLYRDSTTGNVIGSTSGTSGGISAANTIFDLSVVSSTGVVTLHQFAQIDHALPGDTSNYSAQQAVLASGKVGLIGTAVITDGDGDTATDYKVLDLGGNVKFDDDGPVSFSPTAITLSNSGTASGSELLNAAGTVGADVPGTGVFYDDNGASLNYLYNGATLLTSGGENIVLSGFGTGTLTGTTASSLQTVFTAVLNVGTDQYTIDFDRAIDDGSVPTSLLGAAPVRSGNPTFNVVNDVGGTDLDLLFSSVKNGAVSTVNVSTAGAGVANQSMNAGETLRIDFMNNALLAGSPNGSDFSYVQHETVNGFAFLVSQNTPSGTTGTVLVKAIDDSGADDKNFGNDTLDTITKVTVNDIVVYGSGAQTPTIHNFVVTAVASGGGVLISGLNEGLTGDATGGDDPRITVFTADGFDRIEMTNTGGGTDFDLAPAGVIQGTAGTAQAFLLPVQMIDYDGDFGPVTTIGVNLTPVPV